MPKAMRRSERGSGRRRSRGRPTTAPPFGEASALARTVGETLLEKRRGERQGWRPVLSSRPSTGGVSRGHGHGCMSRGERRTVGMSTLSRDGAARSAAPESPAPGLDLVRLVDTSVLETTPFEHVCLEGAFPAALYRRLLDNLPETPRYRELRHPEAMQA